MTIIVADLGATNARLAWIKNGKLSEIYRFACNDFKSPTQLIESFMHGYVPKASYLLIGVPGAVINDKVKWTNRDWQLDAKQLKKKLGMKSVVLMNDVQVQGSALPILKKQDLLFLQGNKLGQGPKILVNVGTGLGSCYIIGDNVFPSEYGQTVLGNQQSLETLVSGPAFKKLYQQITGEANLVSAVKIAELCLNKDKEALQTYQYFYKVLAEVLMNLCLTLKATGGVYLCGGILDEKTLKSLKFAKSFTEHPKMKALLKSIPLIFIKKKDFAFLGLKKLAKQYDWS